MLPTANRLTQQFCFITALVKGIMNMIHLEILAVVNPLRQVLLDVDYDLYLFNKVLLFLTSLLLLRNGVAVRKIVF